MSRTPVGANWAGACKKLGINPLTAHGEWQEGLSSSGVGGDAVAARLRQRDAKLAAFLHKKSMRNLNQNAGAVACLRIATRGSAVREVDQHLKTLADNLMALLAANVRDQSHAASVMLVPGMVEPLGLGDAVTIQSFHGSLFVGSFAYQLPCAFSKTHPPFDSREAKSSVCCSTGLRERVPPRSEQHLL